MSLFSTIINAGAGSLMQDPTTGIAAELGQLHSHPALGGQDTGLTAMLASVRSSMASNLSSLSINMPVMAAVESVQKRVQTTDGIMPGTDGGATMQAAFAPLTQTAPMLSSLHAQIQSILASAPIPPTPVQGAPVVPNATATQIAALVSGTTASLTNVQASATAAIAQGQAQLRNFAFGSFLSGNHSPAINDIMKQFTNVPPGLATEHQSMNACVPALRGSVIPASVPLAVSPEVVLAPPVPAQPVPPSNPANTDALKAECQAARDDMKAKGEECVALMKKAEAWQAARNYKAIKEAANAPNATEAEKEAYRTLRLEFSTSEEFNTWNAKTEEYKVAKARYQKANDEYLASLGS